jgi:hypothetical protein
MTEDVITSGGVTAGIDLGLWLLQRYLGPAAATKRRAELEYPGLGRVWCRARAALAPSSWQGRPTQSLSSRRQLFARWPTNWRRQPSPSSSITTASVVTCSLASLRHRRALLPARTMTTNCFSSAASCTTSASSPPMTVGTVSRSTVPTVPSSYCGPTDWMSLGPISFGRRSPCTPRRGSPSVGRPKSPSPEKG